MTRTDELWPGWHATLVHASGGWLQDVADLFPINENGEPVAKCLFCDTAFPLDRDFDLYTTENCAVVCLECADTRAPELAEWTRQYRRMRALRDFNETGAERH